MKRGLASLALLLAVGCFVAADGSFGGRGCGSGCGGCAFVAGGCGPRYYQPAAPVMVERTILVPEYFDEKVKVKTVECKWQEQVRKVMVNKPFEETKEVQVEVVEWDKVEKSRVEKWWECVPAKKMVEREFVVMVPVEEKKQGVHRVAKFKDEMVERVIKRDEGCWETRIVERPVYLRCSSGCGGCVTTCCMVQCAQRVWVPKIVEVKVQVPVRKVEYVDQPYEYIARSCKREVKKETVEVTVMERVERSREVKYFESVPRKKMVMKKVTNVVFKPVEVEQKCMVRVPFEVEREVVVRRCRMVEKKVTVPVYPCWR